VIHSTNETITPTETTRLAPWAWAGVVFLCALHTAASVGCLGGIAGIRSEVPLALHDHAIQEHNAWVTHPMLLRTGLAGGYDPYFMAGYAKNLSSSPSSTMFEVAALLTGGASPAVVYKVVVLLALGSLPWLVSWACALFRLGAVTTLSAVTFFLLYVWTGGGGGGFPLNYALFGMTAYLLAVPLGLTATAAVYAFLQRGGSGRWLLAALLTGLCFLVHVTSVLFLAPAFAAMCWSLPQNTNRRGKRILAVLWSLPLAVIVLNCFWILPAAWLRHTRAPSIGFLSHSDPEDSVGWRLWKIVWVEPGIQAISLSFGLLGLAALSRRDRLATAALAGFAGSGLAFGYLAGFTSSLDFLQPGRQTHALYTAACVLAGIGLAELGSLVRSVGSKRLNLAAAVALVLIAIRVFGPFLDNSVRYRLGLLPSTEVMLPSLPTRPGFTAIVEAVKAATKPGDRIFYEEVGLFLPTEPDPYFGGRYSGLLPQLAGVEVIGGFYLYIGVETNFTQIGWGKFFGKDKWLRKDFQKYARIYRPSAIVCYTKQAREFCLSNPDLIEVTFRSDKDRILVGRVLGFEGAAIRGEAQVAASSGQLRVSGMVPDLDGLIVLRYHHVPGLRSRPEVPIVAIQMEDDPVPFIGLRPVAGQTETTLDIKFPLGR
jgi:hypothetical protein